jgi:hypothetical protein
MNLTAGIIPDMEDTVSFRIVVVGFLQCKEEAWDIVGICSEILVAGQLRSKCWADENSYFSAGFVDPPLLAALLDHFLVFHILKSTIATSLSLPFTSAHILCRTEKILTNHKAKKP